MEVILKSDNWLRSHVDLKTERPTVKGAPPPPGKQFVDFLWPAGVSYASPLCPTFLTEVGGAIALGARPVCLVRDGLVPLLWFFRECPEPKNFTGWLLVHEDLTPFVPSAWRKVTGHYCLESVPQDRRGKKKVDRLILTGIMMDAYCDLADLEERLEQICKELGPSKAEIEEVLAFIPPRTDGFGVEHRHEFAIDYVATLSRFFGHKLKGITWNRFESMESWDGFAVCDLTSRLACADSYLLHRAASKGAMIIGEGSSPGPRKDGQTWISLSPYHGMKVMLSVGGKCVLEEGKKLPEEMKANFDKRFAAAMRSQANLRFPWPTWFSYWAKTTLSEKRERFSSRDN